MNIFKLFKPALNKTELVITSAIEEHLSESDKLIFRHQLLLVYDVERDPTGHENLFTWAAPGKTRRRYPEKKFEITEPSFKLATVVFYLHNRILTADLWLNKGAIFCYRYSSSSEASEVLNDYTIESVTVYL